MAKKKTDPTQVLREFALQLPEAEEGDSCNKSAFRARNKAFLYIGGKDRSFNLMLRLDDSLPVAEECESNSPGNYTVGKGGWTKVAHKFDDDVPVAMLTGWIEESYRVLVHKDLVAQLDGVASERIAKPKKPGKKAVKKKAVKKRVAKKKSARKRR